jgi:DNA-binding MarR family transcriptional regulator
MSPPPETLDFLLVQVCKLHYARMHTLLEELGLYRGQPPVLFALWEREGATHGELATQLHVKPATITKMIKRMEKAGFVERRSDPDDERVSRVYLTDEGRSIRTQVERVWRTLDKETFREINAEERELLRRFFLQMRENLEHVVGGKPPL